MSSTDTPAAPAEEDPILTCNGCGRTGSLVEGTGTDDKNPPIYTCNRCGRTWDRTRKHKDGVAVTDGAPPSNIAQAAPTSGQAPPDAMPAPEPEPAVKPDGVTGPGEHNAAAVEPHVARPDFDDAMGTLPSVPGRLEFADLAMQARMLSLSPLAPKILRGNPWACMDMAMTGRALGVDVFTAADLIDIIPDAGEDFNNPTHGRKSPSPELINARIQQLGMGSIRPLGRSARHCVAVALLPGGTIGAVCERLGRHFNNSPKDWQALGWEAGPPPVEERPDNIACTCTGVLGHSEFTWEMAREAGLVGPNCNPGDHHEEERPGKNGGTYRKEPCRTGYVTWPERMMWWRAAGFCADDYFPAAGLGLYSPDALGQPVDENGRLIDPGTIELPEGFEPAKDPAALPAEEAEILPLMWHITQLPDAVKGWLRERWEADRVPPITKLPAGSIAKVEGLLRSADARARSEVQGWVLADMPDGWTPGTAPSATAPQEPKTAAGGTDTQPPAETATGPAEAVAGVQPRPMVEGQPTEPNSQCTTLAIAQVKDLTARDLNGRLRTRAMDTSGEVEERRRRLGYAIALELTVAEWQDAQAATTMAEEGEHDARD